MYRLCIAQPQPYSEPLYLRLKEFLEKHVDELCRSLMDEQADLLPNYLKKWNTYSVGSEFCHQIFRYLVRLFIFKFFLDSPKNMNWIRKRLEDSRNKLGSIYQGQSSSSTTEVYEVYTVLFSISRHSWHKQLALVTWRDHLFRKLKDRILRATLDLITQDRDGEQVNLALISGVVNSYGVKPLE